METRLLRYFVAVADAGHMTRAAAQLGIQQPPLSQQIRALEARLGITLFHRHPKGVSLTDGGRMFLVEARRLLQELAAMEARMQRVARGERGQLHIAFTSSAAAHAFTPRALRECRRRFPEIDLVLSEHNAAEITEAIADGRLHGGFLRVPVSHPPGVKLHTLLREATVVAVPLDHPLARRRARRVALQDLDGENLILVRRPGAPGLYANLLTRCAQAGVQPTVVAEVPRMMTNLNLVAAGVGISVVPASMQGAHPHAIRYLPLSPAAKVDAPLTLAHRESDCEGALATFVALVLDIAAHGPGKMPAS